MDTCDAILAGVVEYEEAWNFQKELFQKRVCKEVNDTIILLEHPHVITIGKNGNMDNLLTDDETLRRKGIKTYKIERGGDITYHGYGQIVGYIIMSLDKFGRDIHTFVSKIEELFITLLKNEYNINAEVDKQYPGVWVNNRKIVAVGFSVKKWTTYHGFAFNVNTDLTYFNLINPCGIKDRGVTSLEEILGEKVEISLVQQKIMEYFQKVYDYKIIVYKDYNNEKKYT